jgi:predicted permease
MLTLWRDLRYGARMLRKNPGFTTVAIVTLALCIGANLTIFAVVDSVLLRPLPFPEPDRLVTMFNSYPRAGKDRDTTSLTSYYERQGNIPAFAHLAGLMEATAIVGESGSTERVTIGRVSTDFFATLGVAPVIGRAFTESEMTYQTDHEAILTDEYWRQHFNADPNVLGREIRSDGLPRKIVGVLPPGYRFLSSQSRIFLPLSSEEAERNLAARHNNNMMQIARLKPGATIVEAQMQIDAHNAAQAAEFPQAKEVTESGFHTTVVQLHADHVASIRPTLLLLQAGVLFLLLIGGVNLVNLLLIRASGRTKELAIRRSMGASRWHVVSQVMVETVLLTFVGGLLGLVVGVWGIRLLAVLGTDQLPLGAHIAFDGRVALVALAGSILFGFVIATPIAWFNLREHLANALQSESRGGTASRSAQRLRHGFIVAQVAMAFVLLTGAGLLGLSLKRAMAVSPGFGADHILTGQFNLPWSGYRDQATFISFADRLMEEVGHQPGVLASGLITDVPLSGIQTNTNVVTVVGYTRAPGASVILHYAFGVAGNYFRAMGIPLREGRYIDHSDSHSTLLTCVIDEDFARRYWPQGGAIGQQVYRGDEIDPGEQPFTIVGVVGAVKQTALFDNNTNGAIYFPYSRYFSRNYFLVARTSLPPEFLGPTIRTILRQVDPELPLDNVRSMEVRIADSLVMRRSPAVLTGIFAGVALLLAAIGTYGVLSYAVAQRRREIGVRMALGAQPSQIRSHFLSVGLRLFAVGAMFGVVGAWMAGRAMKSVLFNVPALPLATVAGTVLVMGLVSLVACWLPARRASKVDPLVALRSE